MNRRQILKGIATPLLAPALRTTESLFAASETSVGPASYRTPPLAEFEKLRLGVSFHFGMNTFTGDDYDEGKHPATTYDPVRLDVKQWLAVAHDFGAKYAILTAKHMTGFALWESAYTDYGVAASSNKTDVVSEFVSACLHYGIRPGYYYCILDPHNEGKLDWTGKVSPDYYSLIRHQVAELHTKYPGAFYQLFDIPGKLTSEQRWDLYRLVKSINPTCLVVYNQCFDRSRRNQGRLCEPDSWPTDIVNGEDTLPPLEGHAPQIIYEDKPYYMPFETWLPVGPIYKPLPYVHSWFWHQGFKTESAEIIAEAYRDCMKGNANLLLNLSPDNTGRLGDEAVQTLRQAARLMHG
jgi:alpha-L-fucosidase